MSKTLPSVADRVQSSKPQQDGTQRRGDRPTQCGEAALWYSTRENCRGDAAIRHHEGPPPEVSNN